MQRVTHRPSRRRRHGTLFGQPDRWELECTGWRTFLDYHENHIRGTDGMLIDVVPQWTAEAERIDGHPIVASVTATTVDEAWAQLRRALSRSGPFG